MDDSKSRRKLFATQRQRKKIKGIRQFLGGQNAIFLGSKKFEIIRTESLLNQTLAPASHEHPYEISSFFPSRDIRIFLLR